MPIVAGTTSHIPNVPDSKHQSSPSEVVLQGIAAELNCAAMCLWTNGCAATPYTYGRFHPDPAGRGVDIQPLVVEHGTPNKTLDRIGWVVGASRRHLTLNKNVNNHKISPETRR